MKHHYKNKKGFTLAEVLITLGIIGVVAALTLPALIQNYQKKATATSVKKAYSELNQIIERAKADYGDPSGWSYYEQDNLAQWVQTYIEPYVKVIKSGSCSSGKCMGIVGMHALGYNVASNSANASYPQYMVVKGGDSVAYGFYRYASVYEPITRVKVYIRNPKKYAFIGKDVFTFIFDRRETNPSFRPFTPHDYNVPKYNYDRTKILGTSWGACNPKASGGGYWSPGEACSGLIMLDNWEIKEDYPW